MNRHFDPPEYIYRYHDLRGKHGRVNVEALIENNQIYFASPTSFNDPFDCAAPLSLGRNTAEIDKWLQKSVNQTFPRGLNRAGRRAKIAELKSQPYDFHQNRMIEFVSESLKNSAICCFSSVNDHELMWSHYADQHRGVCWKFKQPENLGQSFCVGSAGTVPIPVKYSEHRHIVDITKLNDKKTIDYLLLTKSKSWEYENEFRCIEWRKNQGCGPYPQNYYAALFLDPEFQLTMRILFSKNYQ